MSLINRDLLKGRQRRNSRKAGEQFSPQTETCTVYLPAVSKKKNTSFLFTNLIFNFPECHLTPFNHPLNGFRVKVNPNGDNGGGFMAEKKGSTFNSGHLEMDAVPVCLLIFWFHLTI